MIKKGDFILYIYITHIIIILNPDGYNELGGFRHSDTVVVTNTGIEILTYYPRDLESLTIPI